MLTRALDLYDSAEKPRDRDWLSILLEFLKAYVHDLGKALLITKDDHVAYTSSLIHALQEAARALDAGQYISRLHVFTCNMPLL